MMLDYEYATCAYPDVPHDGTGIADEVDNMLYVPCYCNCP